jgi:AraC-like DNA-binding protein/mannose-6-phosphate isomerase-like protein (cupin superfamily)
MSQISQNRDPNHQGDNRDPARAIVTLAKNSTAPGHYPWHSHFRAQLAYATEGVMRVSTTEGRWLVVPQQAVWIPPGVSHQVDTRGSTATRFLYVHPAACAGLPDNCRVLGISGLLRELILRLVSFGNEGPLTPAQARLMAIVPDELRALRPEPLYLPLPRDGRLHSITDVLTAAPADNRSLAVWARAAGASESTLARLFTRETGMTFGAWRQRLRLVTAVGRLAEGQSVTTVAYDLGYDSPSAFIAMFKRNLGETPGRYLAAAGQSDSSRSAKL